MIRVLLGSALPVLGLGLAAAFVAPSLVATSGVEPMIVGGADPAVEFQPASFERSSCASTLLFADAAGLPGAEAGLRVMALAPRTGPSGRGFDVREVPPGASTAGAAILLLVTGDGRILAAREHDGSAGPCADDPAARKAAGAI